MVLGCRDFGVLGVGCYDGHHDGHRNRILVLVQLSHKLLMIQVPRPRLRDRPVWGVGGAVCRGALRVP